MTGDSGDGAVTAGGQADIPIIETRDVSRHFSAGRAATGRARVTLKAVDGVSLAIRRGETLALVGETGSGKTTFGRLLLGLYRPTSGDILYQGQSILDRKGQAARAVRRQIQGVFQDPYSSLNPTMTVGQSLAEVLKVHRVVGRQDRAQKVAELLETVGLSPAQASRRPLAFSGGERQRVGIARALAVSPDIVIADEPLSALDVSIQAQVLNLMIRLQEERALTGDIPNAIDRPRGCHFHPRCPLVMPVCKEVEPQLRQLSPTQSVACHLHDPDTLAAAAG